MRQEAAAAGQQLSLLVLLYVQLLLLLDTLQLDNLGIVDLDHFDSLLLLRSFAAASGRRGRIELANEHHILAADDIDTARNVAILVAHVDALDGAREKQVGVLINATQVANERAAVT